MAVSDCRCARESQRCEKKHSSAVNDGQAVRHRVGIAAPAPAEAELLILEIALVHERMDRRRVVHRLLPSTRASAALRRMSQFGSARVKTLSPTTIGREKLGRASALSTRCSSQFPRSIRRPATRPNYRRASRWGVRSSNKNRGDRAGSVLVPARTRRAHSTDPENGEQPSFAGLDGGRFSDEGLLVAHEGVVMEDDRRVVPPVGISGGKERSRARRAGWRA